MNFKKDFPPNLGVVASVTTRLLQCSSVKPMGHLHENVGPCGSQTPPLEQGFCEQGCSHDPTLWPDVADETRDNGLPPRIS